MKVITGRLSPCVVLAVGIEVLAHELGAVSFDAGHLKSWAHTAESDGAVDGRGFSHQFVRPQGLSGIHQNRGAKDQVQVSSSAWQDPSPISA